MENELVTVDYLIEALNLSRQTIYRMRKTRQVPDQVQWPRRALRWFKDEIDAWVAAKCPPQNLWREMWALKKGGR